MKVAIGTFAHSCIEAHFGLDLATGVRAALRSYARGLESASPPVAFPDFRAARPAESPAVELELAVEPEVEAAIEREARRRRVRVEQLLDHAVFVYLATAEESSATFRLPQ
jgi:hypothetical protein